MSLVEKLCKEIGVEVGKEWKATDGNTYWIDPEGSFYVVEYSGIYNQHRYLTEENIKKVLSGEIKPIEPEWTPSNGEEYYAPSIYGEDKYMCGLWTNSVGDKRNLERKTVFKTKEEAITMANKIIEFIKEERENE